jgi:hypothetical protein
MGFLTSLGMTFHLVYQGGGKERRAEDYLQIIRDSIWLAALSLPFTITDELSS